MTGGGRNYYITQRLVVQSHGIRSIAAETDVTAYLHLARRDRTLVALLVSLLMVYNSRLSLAASTLIYLGGVGGGRKAHTTKQKAAAPIVLEFWAFRLAAGPERCYLLSRYSSHNRGGDLLDLVLDALDCPVRIDQLPLHSSRLHRTRPQRVTAEERNHASTTDVLSDSARGSGGWAAFNVSTARRCGPNQIVFEGAKILHPTGVLLPP